MAMHESKASVLSHIEEFVAEAGKREFEERIKPSAPKLNERTFVHRVSDLYVEDMSDAVAFNDVITHCVREMARAMNAACLNCPQKRSGAIVRPHDMTIEIQSRCDITWCGRELKLEERLLGASEPIFNWSAEPSPSEALASPRAKLEKEKNELEKSKHHYESFGSWS